jgi:sodium/potassium/calcium exchanger 6
MGYPLMALSACFGGPMLNILLGIGFSGTYMTAITHQPVHIKMNTTLFVSGISLLVVLLITLISVPLGGFVLSRRWAYGIIAVYLCVMTANVVVEIMGEREG